MKKINFFTYVMITTTLLSCGESKSDCEYSNLTISAAVDGKQVDQKKGNDCYSVKTEGDGELKTYTVSGKKTSAKFSLTYFKENNKIDLGNGDGIVLRFLNVKVGDKTSEWRATKGHNIYMIEKKDTLGFIFGDNAKKENSISGSILLTK